jgi:polyisoprenyl-teichoic acid--peptidoglycan teichoic acid transferase
MPFMVIGNELNLIARPDRRISFPALLLLIFVLVQISLFLIIDFPNLSQSSGTSPQTAETTVQQVGLQQTLGTSSLNTEARPQIPENDNLTSLLVVGLDARNVALVDGAYVNTKPQGQAGTRNTDTLIQVVYDNTTGNTFMISIPRDMGVDVREDCLHFSGSLHWVYDKALNANCPDKGIDALQHTIEGITGIKIQYHIFITLDVFQDIINIVGEKNSNGQTGIYVDNPRTFSDIYPADDQSGWVNVHFPQGRIFLTPYHALQFARAREWTSDFDRAKRQQLVIQAVLQRVLSANTLLDPFKLNDLMNTYKNKVLVSQPTSANELIELVNIVRNINTSKIYHMVLDPNFGGYEVYLNKQPHDRPGPYYMVPTAWKQCPGNEFCKVQERIKAIIVNPDLLK